MSHVCMRACARVCVCVVAAGFTDPMGGRSGVSSGFLVRLHGWVKAL